jgi:hypothetical protein
MHALFAQVHHWTNLVLATPTWCALLAAAGTGLILRIAAPARAALAACVAVTCGSLALALPATPLWHATPIARLPGAFLLLALSTLVAGRPGRARYWLLPPIIACITAWWLRGAPLTSAGIAGVVPVVLGLLAAAALVRRLASHDTGSTGVVAATTLAAAIWLATGATPWVFAALLPACAGLVLLGRGEAAAPLAQAATLVGVATVVAADRGRLLPIDIAALAPLLVWVLAPRLQPRLNRAGPILSAGLAALCGIALFWAATRAMWPH